MLKEGHRESHQRERGGGKRKEPSGSHLSLKKKENTGSVKVSITQTTLSLVRRMKGGERGKKKIYTNSSNKKNPRRGKKKEATNHVT